jgi:Mor family transcriptional regulator
MKTKGKFNHSYQAKIILRMFEGDEKRMAEFHEDYSNACLYAHANVVPSKQDYAIAADYSEKRMLVRELTQKYKMTHSKVMSAVNRVARYQAFSR